MCECVRVCGVCGCVCARVCVRAWYYVYANVCLYMWVYNLVVIHILQTLRTTKYTQPYTYIHIYIYITYRIALTCPSYNDLFSNTVDCLHVSWYILIAHYNHLFYCYISYHFCFFPSIHFVSMTKVFINLVLDGKEYIGWFLCYNMTVKSAKPVYIRILPLSKFECSCKYFHRSKL